MEKEHVIKILVNITRSELRLESFVKIKAPQNMIEKEHSLLKKYRDEIKNYKSNFNEEEIKKFNNLEEEVIYSTLKKEEGMTREELSDPYCPACRYSFEFPDGREMSEREQDEMLCSMHPKNTFPPERCMDFDDYGIVKWKAHYSQYGEKLDQLKMKIRELEEKSPELKNRYHIDKFLRDLFEK